MNTIQKTRPPKQVPHYEYMDKIDAEREVWELFEKPLYPFSLEHPLAKLSYKFIPEDALDYYKYGQIPE